MSSCSNSKLEFEIAALSRSVSRDVYVVECASRLNASGDNGALAVRCSCIAPPSTPQPLHVAPQFPCPHLHKKEYKGQTEFLLMYAFESLCEGIERVRDDDGSNFELFKLYPQYVTHNNERYR